MKFLKFFLPLFALFFSLSLQADDRQGAGFYVSGEVYEDLGIGVGHQFGLPGSFALRFETMFRPERLDLGQDQLAHNLKRYGAFLDLGLADSRSFIYLGSAYAHSNMMKSLSVDSGVVWRMRERFALRLGHEYRNWGDFNSDSLRGHTFRFGVVHFFKRL